MFMKYKTLMQLFWNMYVILICTQNSNIEKYTQKKYKYIDFRHIKKRRHI